MEGVPVDSVEGGTWLTPEKTFFIVSDIVGDLEHHVNTLHLNHWSSHTLCYMCLANRTTIPWTDISPTAAWRATVVTRENVIAEPHHHPLMEVPGVTFLNVAVGMMHTLDLGVALYLLLCRRFNTVRLFIQIQWPMGKIRFKM